MARHPQQRRTRPILLLRPHLWQLRYPLRTFLPDILSHVHHAVSLLPSVVSQTPEMLPQAWRKLPQHHSRRQQQQYHRTVSSNDGRCHFRISCHRILRRPARQSLSRKSEIPGTTRQGCGLSETGRNRTSLLLPAIRPQRGDTPHHRLL